MEGKAMIRSVIGVVTLLTCSAAHAQEIETLAGGWLMHREVFAAAGIANCVISKGGGLGDTKIEIAINPFKNTVKVAFDDDDWASLENGKKYALGLRFDPGKIAVLEEFDGINANSFTRGVYKWFDSPPSDLLAALASNDSVSVDLAQDDLNIVTIADIDLAGSANAIESMQNCGRAMLAQVEAAENADPFR